MIVSHTSSGINRIPSYMARVAQGALDAKVTPDLKKLTPVVAQVRMVDFLLVALTYIVVG